MSETTARVDFVVAGVQKSGTRALGHFLSKHPGIGLSRVAEPHYFDLRIHRGKAGDYSGYHALFTEEALAKVTGDITPIYIFQHGCMEAVRAYNPDMRVIVVLRNPVARAYSQWAMEVERGSEHRPFWRAVLHELIHTIRWGQHPVYSYVQRGFYSWQLARLFALFPPNQCLILLNEEMRENHAETYGRVLEFLGVGTEEIPPFETIHSRDYEQMPPFLRRVLGLIYRRDIKKLEKMTGLDCSRWR